MLTAKHGKWIKLFLAKGKKWRSVSVLDSLLDGLSIVKCVYTLPFLYGATLIHREKPTLRLSSPLSFVPLHVRSRLGLFFPLVSEGFTHTQSHICTLALLHKTQESKNCTRSHSYKPYLSHVFS